jgi:glycosyltransferase involved in cell wall biosynthesis
MSSGVQRTLSFSMHLAQHGWRPAVLTATPESYERANPNQLKDIPAHAVVGRATALDAARHLAIGGRYWSRLAIPDRWRGWWLTAVPRGLQLIRSQKVDVIWSTYPIATAHVVGATLARLTGLPWIADFRDPMVEAIPETGELFPKDPVLRNARLRIERKAAERAARMVFCTQAARQIVRERYPRLDDTRLAVISNGYEEHAFRDAETLPAPPSTPGKRVLLHSGTIYPGTDRDPTALFAALKSLAAAGRLSAANFELRLRDPSNEDYFRRLALEQGVADLVSILPPLSYREALAEMRSAHALLLLQGYTSNPAVPAKLYEYLRAARPVIALAHPDGETAATLRAVGIDTMAPLTEREPIARLLLDWLQDPERMQAALPSRQVVAEFSRERLTARLAQLLDDVAVTRPTGSTQPAR